MCPRGVPMPDVREQLFVAAEQVLATEGPNAVSGRAVARAAGCATGLIYNYFTDLEDFLTTLIVDRFAKQAAAAAGLPDLAGTGTVEDNLVGACSTLLRSHSLALAGLVVARPSLRQRVGEVIAGGAPGLLEVTSSIAVYLEREKRLGRIDQDADSEAIALGIVGTIHHLLFSYGEVRTTQSHAMVERLVRALVGTARVGTAVPGRTG